MKIIKNIIISMTIIIIWTLFIVITYTLKMIMAIIDIIPTWYYGMYGIIYSVISTKNNKLFIVLVIVFIICYGSLLIWLANIWW